MRSAGRSTDEIAEERDFLLTSIEDLDREHAAGDVDDADFAALRGSYVERAAAATRALAAVAGAATVTVDAAPAEAVPVRRGGDDRVHAARRYLGRRGTRRVLVVVGLVCAAGLVLVVAARAAGLRLPGQYSSGSVVLSSAAQVRQELAQASVLATEGQLAGAISTYDLVLSRVPHQPEALAYKGWFVRLVGIADRSPAAVGDGDVLLSEAVRVAPGYAEARAFYAVALAEDQRDVRGAIRQLRGLLADRPSPSLLRSVASEAVVLFKKERLAVPGVLRRYAPTTAPPTTPG